MTGEADKLWCGDYTTNSPADIEDEAWAEFTTRAAAYCQRIAALYAVLDGRTDMSKDDLAAAAALVRYSLASARYVLDGLHRDPRMDRLIRAIDGAGPAGLTRTEISALFGRHLPRHARRAARRPPGPRLPGRPRRDRRPPDRDLPQCFFR